MAKKTLNDIEWLQKMTKHDKTEIDRSYQNDSQIQTLQEWIPECSRNLTMQWPRERYKIYKKNVKTCQNMLKKYNII